MGGGACVAGSADDSSSGSVLSSGTVTRMTVCAEALTIDLAVSGSAVAGVANDVERAAAAIPKTVPGVRGSLPVTCRQRQPGRPGDQRHRGPEQDGESRRPSHVSWEHSGAERRRHATPPAGAQVSELTMLSAAISR